MLTLCYLNKRGQSPLFLIALMAPITPQIILGTSLIIGGLAIFELGGNTTQVGAFPS